MLPSTAVLQTVKEKITAAVRSMKARDVGVGTLQTLKFREGSHLQ